MSAVFQPTCHWTEASIESVALVEFGTRVTKRVDAGTRYPVYGGGGATFSMDEYNREDCYIVSRFGMSEECVRRVHGKFFLNDSGLTVKTRDKSLLFQRFLDIYLLGSQSRIFGLGRGAAQKNLNVDAFRQLSVPLPPLSEQMRIVAVLDQAFAALDRARANAEANLADADSLVTRAMDEILGEVVEAGGLVPVSEAAEHCLGKMLDRNKNTGDPRPYLRNINVRWFEIDQSDLLEMRIEEREVGRYLVKNGDLLICEGGYPGRASIYESDAPIFFQKALHRVRFKSLDMAKILMYWLNLQDRTGALRDHFTGSGIQHFTGQALARFLMPIADETVLKEAVARLEALHRSVADLSGAIRQKLSDIAALRQSLLQAAFSGQMT